MTGATTSIGDKGRSPSSHQRPWLNTPSRRYAPSSEWRLDNENIGPENVLEEIFSDHESFCQHDTESEEEGDSRNDDVNNLELFSSKEGTEWRKKLGKILVVIILCRCYLEKKAPPKDVRNPVKSWELFINDNMIHLIVE
ncbi:hypothetical protein AVEN_219436-1 [Araneus ventricosus]|uniref:Uncharacterized protein n=1 Tax=Araneus ventricosus TaxID=182803 RepID=A0A4Y2T9T6_ARAVE|nr:hypothetical protein AVEN_36088-1 [Araneus ventricosus]GBN97412.1 hypothetical protein AVEN_219436-1 [Araneus ventricosus]